MTVTILGPQRFRKSLGTAVRNLGVEGTVAVVNAGWQEREADDTELGEVLAGRMHNLRLFTRWEQVLEDDPGYAEIVRVHHELLDEQQALYAVRLQHTAEGLDAVVRRPGPSRLREAAYDNAFEELRALDSWHLRTLDALEADFAAAHRPVERPAIAQHRAEVADALQNAEALALAGGHVGVLARCLQLFLDAGRPAMPVVAWSAGAMAIAELVVLFNDFEMRDYEQRDYETRDGGVRDGGVRDGGVRDGGVRDGGVRGRDTRQGSPPAEVYRRGLGWYQHVIPLPHARRRLRLHDPVRVAAFARRFSDARCLVLDDGAQVRLPEGGGCPAGFPVLSPTGQVALSGVA